MSDLDPVETALILAVTDTKKKTTDLLSLDVAAKQTLANRIDKLVNEGYLKEERKSFPPTRYLSLTEKGLDSLELIRTLQRDTKRHYGSKNFVNAKAVNEVLFVQNISTLGAYIENLRNIGFNVLPYHHARDTPLNWDRSKSIYETEFGKKYYECLHIIDELCDFFVELYRRKKWKIDEASFSRIGGEFKSLRDNLDYSELLEKSVPNMEKATHHLNGKGLEQFSEYLTFRIGDLKIAAEKVKGV